MPPLIIPDGDLDEWLSVLKPYQESTLRSFLLTADPEGVAERWLAATGSPNIAPFGGARDTKPFWERFQTELRTFLCDDDAYAEEKKALSGESQIGKAVFVSVISAALGATMGFAAALLAPAVAILLCVVGKVGLNAYCVAETAAGSADATGQPDLPTG